MTTPAKRRLMRDLKNINADKSNGFTAAPTEDNILLWNAYIFGPESTPFEGGLFQLSLQFTEEYPFKPPSVRFETPMFHPNIYADGRLCMDVLQAAWSPTYDVATILTSIQSLLDAPNASSAANFEAGRLYTDNKGEYELRIRKLVDESVTNHKSPPSSAKK